MSLSQTENSKRYFPSIDGLRLLAAVNIIFFHYEVSGGFNNLSGNPAWFFRVVKGPALHASLFFILAGFIYTIKYAAHAHEFSIKRFIKSRLRDLYPLHFITTISMLPFIFFALSETDTLPIKKVVISLFMHLSLLWSLFPLHTYSLNTPSWALSAFFYCYLLFIPSLKIINKIEKKRMVIWSMVLCLTVIFLWALVYALTGFKKDLYMFFHIFAPIRFFEFALGMLLARLFQIRIPINIEGDNFSNKPFVNDLYIIITGVLIFVVLLIRSYKIVMLTWLSYHLFLPICFCILMYRFARGNGMFASFFAKPLIRRLGKSSFYPYLLHIPFMSWLCWICLHGFNYKTFIHSPVNVFVVVIVLYGLSLAYVSFLRKRKPAKFKNRN